MVLRQHLDIKGLVALKAAELLGRLPAVDLWQDRPQSRTAGHDAADVLSDISAMLASVSARPGASDAIIDLVADASQPTSQPTVSNAGKCIDVTPIESTSSADPER
jgi:hypothetical protein